MEVSIGGRSVIASGVAISINDQPIRFTFTSDFIIEIRFSYDQSNNQNISSAVSQGVLVISFSNFVNPLGAACREPLRLGVLNDLPISLSFSLDYIGNQENHILVFKYVFLRG